MALKWMRRDVWSYVSLLVIAIAATGAVLLVRMYIVEPEAVALACATASEGWRCIVRGWAVAGFLNNAFGITAVIAGVGCTLLRWRWLALLAILAGICGAVLYTFELSGMGLLLGALTWVRGSSAPVTREHGTGEQQV